MFAVSEWWLWASILLAAYYLWLPLLIRGKQRYAAHPEMEEVDPDALDPQTGKLLRLQAKRLASVGFGEETFIRIPKPNPIVSSYTVMAINRLTGDKASANVLVTNTAPPVIHCYVEFSTRFEGGDVFVTHNIPDPLAYPPDPGHVRTQVPTVKDPCELYRLHEFVMEKSMARGKKVVYQRGQALVWLRKWAYAELTQGRPNKVGFTLTRKTIAIVLLFGICIASLGA